MKLFSRKQARPDRELAPAMPQFERLAQAQPQATAGAPTFAQIAEMEQDAMVQTAIRLKRLTILAGQWTLEPGEDSPQGRQRRDLAERLLESAGLTPAALLDPALDCLTHGWAIAEKVYTPGPHGWTLTTLRPKNPEYFGLQLSATGAITGLTLELPGESPRNLPVDRFLIVRHRVRYDRPRGQSDLEAAWPHFRAKRALMRAWQHHLERFAMPTVLGKFERGLPAEEQDAILAALRELQRHTAIVFPSEISIDTLETRSGTAAFEPALDFHNRELARAILGQTLTTDEGRKTSSLALGRVHLQVLLLQIDALRREFTDQVLNQGILRPLVELNAGPGPMPRFRVASPPLEVFQSGVSAEA